MSEIGVDFRLWAWQVAQSKQYLVWLAGYCWVYVGVEEGWTFSQDVASLPSLRGSQEESSVPFNFFICAVFVKATFPELGLQLVLFFLCCLPHSQLEGQENRSGKLLHVCHRWLQDGSTRLRLVLAASCPGSRGQAGEGLNNTVPWGQCCSAPLLTQGLTSTQGALWVQAALSALFLWRDWRGSSTRQPEVARALHNFQFLCFIF